MSIGRRQFVQRVGVAGLGLLAGCALPFAAPPPASQVRRIGRLTVAPSNAEQVLLDSAFREGLREFGFVAGQNLIIEQRYADGNRDRIAELVTELVRLRSEVIVVSSAQDARAALAATSTVPIVSAGAGDLVASGLAASYARPGGTVTGPSSPDLLGKQLQLFQEVVPSLRRVALLFDASNPEALPGEMYEAAARTLGLRLQLVGVLASQEMDAAFDTATREHADGVFLSTGSVISNYQTRIAELALQSGLPSMWRQPEAVGRGGLMAYGPNRVAQHRRAAYYVDKILRGAKPADLPVEHPTLFDFPINLKTAQALGLTIPQHVLLQATEVLQ